MKPRHIEPVLRRNMDIIESFSWITGDLRNIPDLKVTDIFARDTSRLGQSPIRVLGVGPRFYESSHNHVEHFEMHN
jgi:hypothetical protein